MEKVGVEISPIKITLKEAHRNDIDSSTIEITLYKSRRNDVEFWPIKIMSKKFVKSTWKFFHIFFCFVYVISTSNRRRFNVLCSLGTELVIVTTVVIRLELFESQRCENPVKTALKSSEKVTINQPVTRGTVCLRGANFIKSLDKAEVENCHFSII